ncbi:MAG: histidine phosphatase family protein [Pseudohongiellaceae bacterium]
MKTLYLLRHAKSSWENPGLKDFERPLNERGTSDVPVMAERFNVRKKKVDCIIASPAQRAKTTARLFARGIHYPEDNIASNPELYFAGTGMLLKAASLADDTCESVMLVGHNPAITEFANAMAGCDIDNVPTCGLVELTLPVAHWADIELGGATLVEFDFPKNADND